MRIRIAHIILVIFLGFSLSAAGQIAAPPMPLKLPDDVAWVQTFLTIKKDGTREYQRHAFITKGEKFRLEYELFNRPTTIIVFDGKSLGTNGKIQESKDPKHKTPEFWDARIRNKQLYALMNKSHYKGIEKIDNHNCWHFSAEGVTSKINLWVDVNKMIPRRIFVDYENGSASRDLFDDLPEQIKITPELFDPKNLNVNLLGN